MSAPRGPGLTSRSRAWKTLLAEVRRFAKTDANVLITGETGAGKDLIAQALHGLGPRRPYPFVKVDCPSLPPTLLESELFGYERGAFTDATAARAGRFELAGRGTVYLDRVNELPLELQPKLLRLVEEKRGERLGGTSVFDVRARIIASTSAVLEDAVRDGTFRSDLYHRLRVLPLHVPPLRERRADILPLARRFARDALASRGEGTATTIAMTKAAARVLMAYDWPGNVRELRHVIERALIALAPDGTSIDADDLAIELPVAVPSESSPAGPRMTLEELERRYIEAILRECRGNQTRAATVLGISRKALWEKRRRWNLR